MYGEDITVRGNLSGVKRPISYDESRFNYRIMERGLLVETIYTDLLDDDVLLEYGAQQKGKNSVEIEELALSSAIFNCSCFKTYFKTFIDEFKGVNKQAKLQFVKDGVFREDDMTETLNGLLDKLDLYDNNETDNDEGDDDY